MADVIGEFFEKIKKKEDTREATAEQREQDRHDMKVVLSTDAGRRVIWSMLEETHMFHCAFTGRSNDTIFNTGVQSVGLNLLQKILRVDPNMLSIMLNARLTKKKER